MTQHFQMILELHVGLKPILDGFGVGLNEVDVVLDGLDGDSSRHFAGAGLGFGLEEVFHLLEAQFICETIFKKFLNKASSGNVLHLPITTIPDIEAELEPTTSRFRSLSVKHSTNTPPLRLKIESFFVKISLNTFWRQKLTCLKLLIVRHKTLNLTTYRN